MIKPFTITILLVCSLFISNKLTAQASAWTELPSNTVSPQTFLFTIKILSSDSANNIYTNASTAFFCSTVIKFKSNGWENTTIGGCGASEVSAFQKDSLGEVYVLITHPTPTVNRGWLYGIKGDTEKLYDTALANIFRYNNLSTFTVTKNANIYVVQNMGSLYGVYQWNKSINNWNYLKGTGNDTITSTSTITGLYSDKNENIIAAVQNDNNQKFVQWSGTKWLEMGINAGYLNGIHKIENIIRDNNGELYGYGTLATLNNQPFRAKWNASTLVWEQLAYTANNPFSDTCIKVNSITFDKMGNIYGISKCTNANNREYVAQWNGTSWQELGNLVINNTINAITVDNNGAVYAGGTFTNASGQIYVAKYQIVTPVKIIQFSVTSLKEMVACKWTTSSEINFAQFQVERSSNGRDFITLGSVAAKADGIYSFNDLLKDDLVSNTTLYYRLKLVDKDGSFTYSEIKIVNLEIDNNDIVVYPTPAKDILNIRSLNGKHLQLFDLTGRKLIHKAFNTHSTLKLDIQHLNKGVYILQMIHSDGKVKTRKFIVD